MKIKTLFLFLLIFVTIPAADAVSCEISPASTTIDLGLSKQVTITCSDWDVNNVEVEPTQYSADCLSLDKSSDTLTSGSATKYFTVTATSMACQESVNDRTIVWKFTPSSGTVPSKSTTVAIQSGLTITASFKNAPYSADAGDYVNIILEVSTTANEDISGISIDTSGSSSQLVSAGLTDKSITKIAASEGQKTQQVSWNITAPSEGTYDLQAVVTSNNADSDTATTTLTTSDASSTPTPTPTPTRAPSGGGGGGGGGGGMLPPPLQAASEYSESYTKWLNSGESEIIAISSDLQEMTGVTQIVAVLNADKSISATLSKVSSLPQGVPQPSGNAYMFFEIVFTESVASTTVEPSGGIDFKVPRAWLNKNSATSSDVQLLKYKDGQWVELQSEVVDQDDQYYYYSADLDSFSIFSVAVVESSSVSLPSIPAPSSPTPTPTPEATETPQASPTPTPTVEETGFNYFIIVGIVIAAIAAAAVVYWTKFKKE